MIFHFTKKFMNPPLLYKIPNTGNQQNHAKLPTPKAFLNNRVPRVEFDYMSVKGEYSSKIKRKVLSVHSKEPTTALLYIPS